MTHSIATMADVLRADPGALRARERRGHAHDEARLRPVLDRAGPGGAARRRRECRPASTPHPVPEIVTAHDGDATVAAYSVVHGRDGEPEWAVLVCDVAPRARAYAKITDADMLASAEREELVGRTVHADADRGR